MQEKNKRSLTFLVFFLIAIACYFLISVKELDYEGGVTLGSAFVSYYKGVASNIAACFGK